MNSISITSDTLQRNRSVRWIAILTWIVIAIIHNALFLIDLRFGYSDMRVACEGVWSVQDTTTCNFNALSPVEEEVLQSWGLSLQHYANVMIIEPIIVSIIYLIPAFFILWRQWHTIVGLLVSVALVMIPYSIFSAEVTWGSIHPALVYPGLFASVLSQIVTTLFIFLLPNGRFSPRWAYIPMTVSFIIPTILMLEIQNVVDFPPELLTLAGVAISISILMGISFQFYRYFRDSTPLEKQQIRWIGSGIVMYGLAILLWILVFGRALAIPAGATRIIVNVVATYFTIIFLSALPVGISFAILRYNLWNFDLTLNRSIVGLLVTAILGFVFVAGVVIVQTVLNAENPLIGLLVSSAAPIALFNPTRKRVREFIDRRVYGLAFNLDELNEAERKQYITNPGALSGAKAGDYVVLDVIGKGGMGEVYKGEGKGQTVAIKTMLPEIAFDPTMKTRFMRESNIGQSLNHPGIAQVYESGDYQGTPYLVMEYIEGVDISNQLKSGETYDVETASTIMREICDALDMAHERGYVHRDIKPGNVMLRENGSAVLMDFGVTKVGDASVALTGTGAVGTIAYMAPEQIKEARNVDHRADIYALGIMLYEMLTGKPPFTGGPANVMFAHLQQPAPDPRDLDDSIPGEFADAIMKALEKEPDNRFQSAGEFARAVQI